VLAYRLFRSTSAFLQTRLEYRRPTPLILVKAYITFCLPSTLVFRRRKIYFPMGQPALSNEFLFARIVMMVVAGRPPSRGRPPRARKRSTLESTAPPWQGEGERLTNWKFVFSPETSDMLGNCNGRCRCS